ncbi:MAG: hypothetical protein Q6L19_07895 [Gloeomargarita sp. GMQP_bins_69]
MLVSRPPKPPFLTLLRPWLALLGWGLMGLPVGAQTEVPVAIISHQMRRTSTGSILVVGEVRNTYPQPLCFVQVDIQYRDAQGRPVGVDRLTAKEAGVMALDQVMASRGVIPPGETSPFVRIRDGRKIQGPVQSARLTAKGLRLRGSVNGAATITNLQIQRQGNDFRLRGTYNATGRAPNKNPEVIAAGYDAQGQIQVVSTLALTDDGTWRGQPLKQLRPGQRQPFDFTLSNPTGNVTQVKVFPSFACE